MKILFCKDCCKYTLEETCNICMKKTANIRPAKFSPEDKLGKWRRIFKKGKQKPI